MVARGAGKVDSDSILESLSSKLYKNRPHTTCSCQILVAENLVAFPAEEFGLEADQIQAAGQIQEGVEHWQEGNLAVEVD